MANSNNVKLVTINVRGLRNALKRRKLFSWMKDNNIDIAFLQETYCTQDFTPYFNAGYAGSIYHSVTNPSHSRGTAITISKNISYKLLNEVHDSDKIK